MKWSACPAGDFNRCKGKEKFPTLAFEVISDNFRIGYLVCCIQYGTRNDQHIVKLDDNVSKIKNGWYQDVRWSYYDIDGNEKRSFGIYLICDGGYLHWTSV
jgi:hypothetical protein